jgi:hypothetical protein
MDLLAEIKSKAQKIPEEDRPGVAALIRHLEQAERCLERGRAGEDDYFTDVIYRTNHAYEGALKEAFEKLTGSDASHKTPHEIENHLEESSVLRSRVLDLMRNYRKEWRNPSTHEYELFFTGQEALLAIITVSAFVTVLLDQVLDQLTIKNQPKTSATSIKTIVASIPNYAAFGPADKTTSLIQAFVSTFSLMPGPSGVPSRESYIEAAIASFLREAEPNFEVVLEPSVTVDGRTLRPDILVKMGEATIVIEVKRLIRPGLSRDAAVLQVLSYAKALKATRAIVLFMPEAGSEVTAETKEFTTTGVPTLVTEIYPKGLTSRSGGRLQAGTA